MYLRQTSDLLSNRELTDELLKEALETLQSEISPISDARGSSKYKRLLARQLFLAQVLKIDPAVADLRKLIQV